MLRGVTVSVISLIGAECALESLSVCAEKTSGTVERVDPRALTGELSAVTGVLLFLFFSLPMPVDKSV